MPKTKRILLSVLFCLFVSTSASAELLSLSNSTGTLGETVIMSLSVDDPSEIAGAAFTLTYDTDDIDIVDVDSTFFDYIEDGGQVAGKGLMVSGAKAQPDGSTTIVAVFSLKVKNSARGDYNLGLSQSVVNNTAAGYSTQGDAVPMLMGTDLGRPISDPLAFYTIAPVTTASGILRIDRDDDGIVDVSESDYGTDEDNPDSDSDDMPDGWEVDYGLLPMANDAGDDLDGDGATNLTEFREGTEPDNPYSKPGLSRPMPWVPLLLLDN